MRNGKLVVGQIGCGAFAHSQDLRNFSEDARCELKYCCDVNPDCARRAAEKFKVAHFTDDMFKVLDDPEVDLIKIATSHEAHLPIIEAASARGKHIFCEKPMAMREEEAFAMIRAINRGKIKFCVDLNRRMAPSMRALKAAWQAHLAAPRHQPWRYVELDRPELPEERNSHLLISIQDESSSYRMVHLDPTRGGGEIIGETTHWLDLACWLFAPSQPVEILAWGTPRLSHGIHLKFSNGDDATIVFSTAGTFDYPKETYELSSHAALFRNNFFVENAYYGIPGVRGEIFPLQRDGVPEVGAEGGIAGYVKKYFTIAENSRNLKFAAADLLVDKGHRAMLDGMITAILEDRPTPCDQYAGWQSVYLALLAIESIRRRQALPVLADRFVPAISF